MWLKLAFLLCAIAPNVRVNGLGGERMPRSPSTVARNQTGRAVQTLYFLSLLPYPDTNPALQPSWDEGPSVFLAEQLAVDVINNRSDILPGYHIELIQGDGGCDISSKALITFVKQVLFSGKQIVGIVGPGCSYSTAAIIGLTVRQEVSLANVHLAVSSSQFLQNQVLSNPRSFGIVGSTDVSAVIVAMMKYNNWTRVATLYDESRLFNYYAQKQLERVLEWDEKHSIGFSSAVYNTHIPLDDLEQAQVRIIVLLVGPGFLAKILCLAYHAGLVYPKFQLFFSPEKPFGNTSFEYKGSRYHCSEQELWMAAYRSVELKPRLFPENFSQSTSVGLSLHEFLTQYQLKIEEYNRLVKEPLFPSYWAPFAYDAVWTLALGLNDSIGLLNQRLNATLATYHYGQLHMTQVIQEAIRGLEFEGLTGTIKFDQVTGEVKRVADLLLYENETYKINIGNFSDGVLFIPPSSASYLIPDSFDDDQTDAFNTGKVLVTAVFIAAVLATNLALISIQILSVIHRNYPSVKASSMKLNHLAYIGCYLVLLTVVAFTIFHNISTSSSSCALRHVVIVTSSVGSSLAVGVILAKTWRLYRILVCFTNPGRFISDKILFTFVVILASIALLLNILWIVFDPFRLEEDSEGDKQCTADNYFVWTVVCISYILVIMLISVWYAAQCHYVPVPRKEFKTTNIIFLGYSLTVVQLAGFSTFFVSLQTEQDTVAFVSFGLTCYLSVLAFLVLLFVPPVWPVIKQKFASKPF